MFFGFLFCFLLEFASYSFLSALKIIRQSVNILKIIIKRICENIFQKLLIMNALAKGKMILLILKPTHLFTSGKSRGNKSWLKSTNGDTISARPCGFSLQIQEEEPKSKKPELITLVWREVIDYFLLLVKSYSNEYLYSSFH